MECKKLSTNTNCLCKKCERPQIAQSDNEFVKLSNIKTESIQKFKCLTKNCKFTTSERESLIMHLLKHE